MLELARDFQRFRKFEPFVRPKVRELRLRRSRRFAPMGRPEAYPTQKRAGRRPAPRRRLKAIGNVETPAAVFVNETAALHW